MKCTCIGLSSSHSPSCPRSWHLQSAPGTGCLPTAAARISGFRYRPYDDGPPSLTLDNQEASQGRSARPGSRPSESRQLLRLYLAAWLPLAATCNSAHSCFLSACRRQPFLWQSWLGLGVSNMRRSAWDYLQPLPVRLEFRLSSQDEEPSSVLAEET